jgi:hypothetical protein
MPKWLEKFRKGRKHQEEKYNFPPVTPDVGVEYVPMQKYSELLERVSNLEQQISVGETPTEKLDFPAEVLESLPNVIKKTIQGILFNYENDFADFCFWGMRKALIDAIRIRFQKDQNEAILYDKDGNAFSLPKWIELAKQARYINNKSATALAARVRVFGDAASHDYMANLQKEEVPAIFTILRITLSRMYYNE